MYYTLGLFIVTAIAEIIGCYLPYLWLKKAASPWVLLPAAASLALFAWLLSLHPTAAGRVYAAYGGVYVSVALVWLWLVDGVRPHLWDFVGVAVTLLGMPLISSLWHLYLIYGVTFAVGQFDSILGTGPGVPKPDGKLSQFDARYPVLFLGWFLKGKGNEHNGKHFTRNDIFRHYHDYRRDF